MLWNSSQETWKEFLTRCYKESATQLKLTLEGAADEVVKVHNAHGAQVKTGQHFNPSSVTEANRLKANCAALQRFMEKEDALEMVPYMLGAMSDEAKLAFANQYLRPAGLIAHLLDKEAEDGLSHEANCDTNIAAAEAMKAVTIATMNPTPENLDLAERAASKAAERFVRTKKMLNGARAKFKNVLAKVCHRKERA